MTTLKVSRGMGTHLLCVRYTKSGVNTQNTVHRIKMPPFMIVHHMKNVVSVWISMVFLSYISASNAKVHLHFFSDSGKMSGGTTCSNKIKADSKHFLRWLSFGTPIFTDSRNYSLIKYRIITLYRVSRKPGFLNPAIGGNRVRPYQDRSLSFKVIRL